MRRTLTVLLAVLLCGCGARENKEHGIRFSSATVTKMDDSSGVAVLTETEDGKRTVEVPYRSSVTVIRDGKTISVSELECSDRLLIAESEGSVCALSVVSEESAEERK